VSVRVPDFGNQNENKDSELNGRKQSLNLNFAIFSKICDLSIFYFVLHFGDSVSVWADGRNCEVMQVFKLISGFTAHWQNFGKRLFASSCLSVHLSVRPHRTSRPPTGRNIVRFYVGGFCEYLLIKLKFY